jgi:hypothetical protein
MGSHVFLRKLILLGFLEIFIISMISWAIPTDEGMYMAALEDKESLLKNDPSPRIIFVGGSNLAFGMNSELIEKAFGMPVINFGLHADLGLITMINEVERYRKSGDIIVIVPEYGFYSGSSDTLYGGNEILADAIELNPNRIQYLARKKWVILPIILGSILERKTERGFTSLLMGWSNNSQNVYTRSNFNQYGDEVGHLDKPSKKPDDIPDESVFPQNFEWSFNAILKLEEFQQTIIEQGGVVYLDFPSLRMRNCVRTGLESFNNLYEILKIHTTIPLLSTPYDRCYPDEYFFDTAYHLNNTGRLVRTQQLIESLRSAQIK